VHQPLFLVKAQGPHRGTQALGDGTDLPFEPSSRHCYRRRYVTEAAMWSTLFGICVGILIGWNLPQPAWAKSLPDRAVATIKGLTNKRDA
jgi:hypothetical protein